MGTMVSGASGSSSYDAWAEIQESFYLGGYGGKPTAEAASDTTATETSGDGSVMSVSLAASTKEYDSDGVRIMLPAHSGISASSVPLGTTINGMPAAEEPGAAFIDVRSQVDVSTISLSALYTAAGKSADGESDTETASLVAQFMATSGGSQGPVTWAQEPDGAIEFATYSQSLTPYAGDGTAESASGSGGSGSTIVSTPSALDPVSAKRTDRSSLLDQLFQISNAKHKSGDESKSDLT
jgi:hypothetical protein